MLVRNYYVHNKYCHIYWSQLHNAICGCWTRLGWTQFYLLVLFECSCITTTLLFYILLTVHLGTFPVHNQLDALFNVFISLLYMLRATECSSSGESIVSIHHLVYRMRHKSVNTSLSHERLVGGLQDGGRRILVKHFVQLYPQPLYTASQVRTTCRSWDEGVLTDVCLTGVLTDLCLTLYIILCRWPSGMQVSDLHTCIQFILLMMSTVLLRNM